MWRRCSIQWLTEGIPTPILNGMTWVSISDPGIGGGHEGFTGEFVAFTSPVPEPSTLLLLDLGAVMLRKRR